MKSDSLFIYKSNDQNPKDQNHKDQNPKDQNPKSKTLGPKP